MKAGRARETFHRYELKYYIPRSDMETIRDIVLPHVVRDPWCDCRPEKSYTVRSIYYDTEDLRFYYEKMDSVKVRKKLRVRTYNLPSESSPAFLEIKRKFGRRGFKERLLLSMDDVEGALNGTAAPEVLKNRSFSERKVMDKFRFNLRIGDLRPVVLVVYEREAFIGKSNDRLRVTLDHDLRSLLNPELDEIFVEEKLKQFEDQNFVLELKFDDFMPRWMARLVTLLNLKARPYSKYCHGIDAWTPHPR